MPSTPITQCHIIPKVEELLEKLQEANQHYFEGFEAFKMVNQNFDNIFTEEISTLYKLIGEESNISEENSITNSEEHEESISISVELDNELRRIVDMKIGGNVNDKLQSLIQNFLKSTTRKNCETMLTFYNENKNIPLTVITEFEKVNEEIKKLTQ